MIATSIFHTSPLHLTFIPYFFCNKLTLFHLTTCLSYSQLYLLFQTIPLPLPLASAILFLFLELGGDKVYREEFFLPLEWVRTTVFVVCHGLVEARGDTIQDDVDTMMVSQVGIDIKSINIIRVFLYSTCLCMIPDLVKSPVQLIVVAIVIPNGVLNLLSSIKPMVGRFALFQHISFSTSADVGKSLYLVVGLNDGEAIIHLKDLSEGSIFLGTPC